MVPVGDLRNNIVVLELAILNNPNHAANYYNRGTLYSQGIDVQAAISDFTKVIMLDSREPNQPFSAAEGYWKRGSIYQEIGNRSKAIADYQRAAELYRAQGKYLEYNHVIKLLESVKSSGVTSDPSL